MKIHSLLLSLMVLGMSAATHAQLQGGASYAQFSYDDSNVNLGALVGTLGYQLSSPSTFNHIFQLKGGLGITDDRVGGTTIEIDRFIQMAYRAEYDFDNELYAFFTPSFGNLDTDPGGDSDWELGIGFGAGIEISDAVDAELSYESFDGLDILSVGARFEF